MKKKILIFINYFLPGYKAGGPTQSIANISHILKEKYDVYIVCHNHDARETEPYPNIESNRWSFNEKLGLNIYYISDDRKGYSNFNRIINNLDFDFLYLNSLWDYYFSILPLTIVRITKSRCKVVLAPRGELNPGALALKPLKKKVFKSVFKLLGFHKMVTWNATNEIESNLIIKHFGDKIAIKIVSNVPRQTQSKWVAKNKEKGKARFIFISRITPMKNLLFLLEVMNKIADDFVLDIYGPIEDFEYWSECLIHIEGNNRISYIGEVPQSEIEDILAKYHFFLLPTKGENFGHAIFEALLYGLPVIISDNTPWRHLEKDGIGIDISLSRSKVWVDTIEKYSKMPFEKYEAMSLAAWCFAKDYKSNPALKSQALKLFTCRDAK